jgi:hypothetical protein
MWTQCLQETCSAGSQSLWLVLHAFLQSSAQEHREVFLACSCYAAKYVLLWDVLCQLALLLLLLPAAAVLFRNWLAQPSLT